MRPPASEITRLPHVRDGWQFDEAHAFNDAYRPNIGKQIDVAIKNAADRSAVAGRLVEDPVDEL